MKILLASLQVSRSGSKGHLHPALKLARALLQRGHELGWLALPQALTEHERAQVQGLGIRVLDPPHLPAGLAKTAAELTALASSRETVHLAYQAFLLDPLQYQERAIFALVQQFAPKLVISDTLVYGPALAARRLGIVDVGFCAGLKLIAPAALTAVYRESHQRLQPALDRLGGEFRNLELLSQHAQLVFTLPSLVESFDDRPAGTVVIGPLPTQVVPRAPQDYALLCFGSALEPAGYPAIVEAATQATRSRGLRLRMASRELTSHGHVEVSPYLDFPGLLGGARAVIHHGGASCFSETLAAGAPQLLIPLVNDQPIQAEVLRRSGAGLTLEPSDVNGVSLGQALDVLLDANQPLHLQRLELARQFASLDGAVEAALLVERLC